ncbi:MAG: hypothetical protein IPK03_15160 [Bacteroidetes bacterium]|nr:hypothetical protein [Bacteroidota bacterium]
MDIYSTYTDKKTKKLTPIINLGAPYNSSKDDFGYIVDKSNRKGYFSSNRPGGLGNDDIYAWTN